MHLTVQVFLPQRKQDRAIGESSFAALASALTHSDKRMRAAQNNESVLLGDENIEDFMNLIDDVAARGALACLPLLLLFAFPYIFAQMQASFRKRRLRSSSRAYTRHMAFSRSRSRITFAAHEKHWTTLRRRVRVQWPCASSWSF